VIIFTTFTLMPEFPEGAGAGLDGMARPAHRQTVAEPVARHVPGSIAVLSGNPRCFPGDYLPICLPPCLYFFSLQPWSARWTCCATLPSICRSKACCATPCC
jgi:hypothetical protein